MGINAVSIISNMQPKINQKGKNQNIDAEEMSSSQAPTAEPIPSADEIEEEARLQLDTARLFAREGQISEAQFRLERVEDLAQTLPPQTSEDLLDEVGDTGYFWKEREDQAFEIGFAYEYSVDTYHGYGFSHSFDDYGYPIGNFRGGETSGSSYKLNLAIPIVEDLRLLTNATYGQINRGYSEYYDSLGQSLPRLVSDESGAVQAQLYYLHQGDSFNLRLNLNVGVNLFSYDIYSWQFNPFYNTFMAETSNAIYSNAEVGFAAGFDLKIQPTSNSTLILGIDAGVDYLSNFNENPSIAGRRIAFMDVAQSDGPYASQAAWDLDRLTDPNESLLSWDVRTAATWIFPSIDISDNVRFIDPGINIGMIVGDDPVTFSSHGFWTLEDINPFQLAFSAGLSASVIIGEEQRLQFPLEFNANYGNYLSLQGDIGVEYNFDPMYLKFNVGGSYFNKDTDYQSESNNNIESWNVSVETALGF